MTDEELGTLIRSAERIARKHAFEEFPHLKNDEMWEPDAWVIEAIIEALEKTQ